jgi:hypothetical protein
MLTGEGKFLVRFVARELIELVIAENPEISVDDEKGISAIADDLLDEMIEPIKKAVKEQLGI